MYHRFEVQAKDSLKNYIYKNGHIDGSALKKHWFSIGKADVFLSHSHKDINKVKAFAYEATKKNKEEKETDETEIMRFGAVNVDAQVEDDVFVRISKK